MPNAKELILTKGIPCDYSLYSGWGNFYYVPRKYPVALIDGAGYVIFHDRSSLNRPEIRVGKRLNVPSGIKTLPEYTLFDTFPLRLPEEVTETRFFEGACERITVNRYERDPKARKSCLAHYGYRCAVCKIMLSEHYGAIAEKLIHVHHLKPLATIGRYYQLDPVQDLRPVCPNCHSVIHRHEPPLSISELQKLFLPKSA